jgi:hypothetical protein
MRNGRFLNCLYVKQKIKLRSRQNVICNAQINVKHFHVRMQFGLQFFVVCFVSGLSLCVSSSGGHLRFVFASVTLITHMLA